MSVIHETLKRARESRQKPGVPFAWLGKAVRSSSMAWTVAGLAVLIAATSLYYREFQSGKKSHTKLQLALLKLNDARVEAEDALKQKAKLEAERDSLAAKKQEVEYDNIEKEKKISGFSRQMHDLEMRKLQLLNENKMLKKRIADILASSQAAPSASPN